MTCKDCVHYEVCRHFVDLINPLLADHNRIDINENTDICKEHFQDRSRFVELRFAEWIESVDMNGDFTFRCSDCNNEFIFLEGDPVENDFFYCPYCGAKMALCGLKNETERALKEREGNGKL